ncbi:MAG: 4-hydroxy-tetrahydrodipicolinate synthase [Spirochaetaceae bacterium]|nr:MAG: 4-hydroxy-tetrahydrodipicolinate synthase [Spirochaetaceae bacterium]
MFEGISTALVTPFKADSSIDEERLREHVERQIAAGVSGLVPVGTTGESPTVSHEENIRIIAITADQAAGRVPVIAGTGSNSTAEAVDMTRKAMDVGANATLQVSPYYNKPSQEGLYRHFSKVADEGGLPVIVYNIPGRTGRNIETETLIRLSAHDMIVAVKEASGNIGQVMDVIRARPDGFDVLAGDDNLALPIMLLGGDGVISVASNIIPSEMQKMVNLLRSGDVDEARLLHYHLLPLFKAMFIDTNPIPVKYVLSYLGYIDEVYRLPMCELSDDNKRVIEGVLDQLDIRA